MHSLQVDAVLFDLDGTLVDESESYREALRNTAQLLLDEPVSSAEALDIKHHPGLNNDWDATWALVAQRRGGPPAPPTDEERASDRYRRLKDIFQTFYLGSAVWEELSGRAAPFEWHEPFIACETLLVSRETLRRLRSFTLGIATSRPRAEALMALHQHDLDAYFSPEAVIAREDAPREKPDPAPLLVLVERLGCRQPIYVGDTVNDAHAAAAAGMPFVAVGPLTAGMDVTCRLHNVNELFTIVSREGVYTHG